MLLLAAWCFCLGRHKLIAFVCYLFSKLRFQDKRTAAKVFYRTYNSLQCGHWVKGPTFGQTKTQLQKWKIGFQWVKQGGDCLSHALGGKEKGEDARAGNSVSPEHRVRLALPVLEVACAIQVDDLDSLSGQGHGLWGLNQVQDLAPSLPAWVSLDRLLST